MHACRPGSRTCNWRRGARETTGVWEYWAAGHRARSHLCTVSRAWNHVPAVVNCPTNQCLISWVPRHNATPPSRTQYSAVQSSVQCEVGSLGLHLGMAWCEAPSQPDLVFRTRQSDKMTSWVFTAHYSPRAGSRGVKSESRHCQAVLVMGTLEQILDRTALWTGLDWMKPRAQV